MSDEAKVIEAGTFKSVLESTDGPAADPAKQFRVVSYVAMADAAPFVIAHLLVGLFAFPYFGKLFLDMGEQLPLATTIVLSLGWLSGPLLVLVDVATFWLLYRLSQRWWLGLLFVPVFIYLMMSAFIGFLLYIPLFPLVTLVK